MRRAPSASTCAPRYSSTSEKLCPVSTWRTGKGIFPGLNALAARCSRTAESLPPLKRRTGRSASAATSRMMRRARDSRRPKWPSGWPNGRTRAVTDASGWPGRADPGPTGTRGRDVRVAAVSMGPLQMLTNLVMYTLVWIPPCVKAAHAHARKHPLGLTEGHLLPSLETRRLLRDRVDDGGQKAEPG